jgi:hypothetical protein
VVFETDTVAGQNNVADSIRVRVRPRQIGLACYDQFEEVTDRELSPLTVRYKIRGTLRCMNPCYTDDDLDFLTSCDDWELLAQRIRRIRNPSLAAPPGAEEDPVASLLASPAGCSDDAVRKALADGKLSGRKRNAQTGQCDAASSRYVPSAPPPPVTRSAPLEAVPETYKPRDVDLEFTRFRTTTDAALVVNGEVDGPTRVGAQAKLRWHFAGPLYVQGYAGFAGSLPLGGLAFGKSPSRYQVGLVATVLPLDFGVQRSVVSLGDVGIGIPNRTGASWIVVGPGGYARARVTQTTAFQSHVGVGTSQDLGAFLTAGATFRLALLYAGTADTDAGSSFDQTGLGTLLSAGANVQFHLDTLFGLSWGFLPHAFVSGDYEGQRIRFAGKNTEERRPYDAWTALTGLGGRW